MWFLSLLCAGLLLSTESAHAPQEPERENFTVSPLRFFTLRTAPVDSAGFYHRMFNGRKTASGALFYSDSLWTAHRTRAFGDTVELCRADRHWRCVSVVVMDRGPFVFTRSWDLSRRAARKLGMLTEGVVPVFVRFRSGETP